MAELRRTTWFSVLPGTLVCWGVLLVALAMVLAIGSEAIRAGTSEGPQFVAPVVFGFMLAILTFAGRRWFAQHFNRLLRTRRVLVAVFLLPLAFQLLLIFIVRTQPTSDFAGYWDSARTLLHGGEYVCPTGDGLEFRARKPPGMAFYLMLIQAVFGESVIAAQLANSVLVLGGNIIFYYLVRRGLGLQAAVCATALLAFWPSRNFSVALLSYDAPGSFVALLFWLLAAGIGSRRWITMVVAGVVGGVAAMLRQPLLLLPFALIAGNLLSSAKRRVVVKNSVLLLLGLSIVIGAWSVRNYRVLGKAVITSTIGGPSLYRSFHPQAGRYYTNVGWDRLVVESDGDEIRLNELGWDYGLRFIGEDPVRAAVRVLRNWHRLLESDHEIAGLVFDTPGGPLAPRSYAVWRAAACGVSDVWYAWLALSALAASVYVIRKGVSEFGGQGAAGFSPRGAAKTKDLHNSDCGPALLFPLLAIGSAFAVHGMFESQPRYFVMYQSFWAVLVAAVWQQGRGSQESHPVSTN